jgi:hypothetical protein
MWQHLIVTIILASEYLGEFEVRSIKERKGYLCCGQYEQRPLPAPSQLRD